MKINLFKKDNSFKKENFDFNPNFYWKIAVFGTFIIILISSFFGYRLFMQINREPVLPVTSGGAEVPTIDKNYIGKVLNYFSIREEKSIEILKSPAPIVDPSL